MTCSIYRLCHPCFCIRCVLGVFRMGSSHIYCSTKNIFSQKRITFLGFVPILSFLSSSFSLFRKYNGLPHVKEHSVLSMSYVCH